MPRMFGTDGVRGIANTAELSPELAFQIGRAAVHLAGLNGQKRPLAVTGMDTRRSSPMLESALAAGICSAGGDVLRLGVATTPAVAHLVTRFGAAFGVMVSASHNPPEYNGIKLFSADGFKLPDAVEDQIEAFVRGEFDPAPRPAGAAAGFIRHEPAAVEKYLDHLVGSARGNLGRFRVVVDCAHGAAYALAPELLRRLGVEVTALNVEPDGVNINAGCGSTHPEMLQQAVLAHAADLGLAHDGDADRCIAVDEKGNLVDGDQIMYLCALSLHRRRQLRGPVVGTVMSNLGFSLALRDAGIEVALAPVGDRYVLEEMQQRGANLGGEQSGHLIFLDLQTTGDGLLTAVQLLSAMAEGGGRPLSALVAGMPQLPQVLLNVPVKSKLGWDERPGVREAIEAVQAELGGEGRVLVRPSGTEPLIRILVEGRDRQQIQEMAQRIAVTVAN